MTPTLRELIRERVERLNSIPTVPAIIRPLLFYLERPIYLVNGRTTSMWFGSTFPDAPKIYLDDSDLVREWDSSTRVFLFVPPFQKARVDSLISSPKYVIAESSGKTVYSNRPGM